MTKLILTDLDDVVLDWRSCFEAWYIKMAPSFNAPVPTTPLAHSFDIREWAKVDKDEASILVTTFNQCKDHFPNITPFKDSVEYITKLKKIGYSFVAITASGNDTWTHDARRENLEKFFPGVFDTIHCVGFDDPKTRYLSRYKPTWWIDDKVTHAESGGKLGHKSFLMTRANNVGAELTHSKRADNWRDIYHCIIDENCHQLGWMA